jgi:hypothetical protein
MGSCVVNKQNRGDSDREAGEVYIYRTTNNQVMYVNIKYPKEPTLATPKEPFGFETKSDPDTNATSEKDHHKK